jgi:hypothetical protein
MIADAATKLRCDLRLVSTRYVPSGPKRRSPASGRGSKNVIFAAGQVRLKPLTDQYPPLLVIVQLLMELAGSVQHVDAVGEMRPGFFDLCSTPTPNLGPYAH